jgi:hypothetical protein
MNTLSDAWAVTLTVEDEEGLEDRVLRVVERLPAAVQESSSWSIGDDEGRRQPSGGRAHTSRVP